MHTNGYKFFVTKANTNRFIEQFIPRDFEDSVRGMEARVRSTNTTTACISHTRHGVSTHVRFLGCAGSNDPFMSVAVEFVHDTHSDADIRNEFTEAKKAGGQGCEILRADKPATDQI